jgi:hypothetical protein
MDAAVVDGAAGGHEGLSGDLAAEDALALLVGLGPAEDVDLNGLEVEQVDEKLQGRAHSPMFAGHRAQRRPARRRGRRYPAPS